MNTNLPRKKIRDWRQDRLLTLGELAALVGVKLQTIWNWEQDRSQPEFRNMRALAKALGVEPQQIIMPDADEIEAARERRRSKKIAA